MVRTASGFFGLVLLSGAALLLTPAAGRSQPRGPAPFAGSPYAAYGPGGYQGGYFGYTGSPTAYRQPPTYLGTPGSTAYSGYGYSPGYTTLYPQSLPYGTPQAGSSAATARYAGNSTAPSALAGSQSAGRTETAAVPAEGRVHVTVRVPAGARVWFQDTPTTSAGPVREFESPPVESGSRYRYRVRAAWTENGREVTQAQEVRVTAGAHVNVTFPVAPAETPANPVAPGGAP